MDHLDRDSEIELLSAIINYQQLNPVVISKITDRCFKGYKGVFSAILNHHKKYKVLPDKSTLKKKFDFEVQKTPEKLEFYIDALKADYKKSLVIDMIVEANEMVVSKPDGVLEMFSKTSKDIAGLFVDDTVYNMAENAPDRWKFYEELWEKGGVLGLPYPYEALNKATMGLKKEELVTIVGVPKSGKTWLALIMLAHLWLTEGVRVYVRSEEMSKEMMSLRVDSYISHLFFTRIKSGNLTPDEKETLKDMMFEKRGDFFISRPAGEDRLDNIRMEIEKYQPDIALVDSSYLIVGGVSKSKGDWQDVKEVTKSIKRMAGEYQISMLNTTQFSKSGYNKSNREKPGAELVAYKSYVEDSDLVISIHDTKEDRQKRIKRISITASRESDVLTFAVNWDFSKMDFSEIENTTVVNDGEDEDGDDNTDPSLDEKPKSKKRAKGAF